MFKKDKTKIRSNFDIAIDYIESAGYDVIYYPEYTSHNYNKIFRNIALIALGVFVVLGGIIIYLIFVVKKIESKIYIMSK
ncbi:MAG: hypothetical protein KAS63_03975 [Candidatus Heimdallarchaeota archaeon]|nr:hypothetical protein [Candidatus Heimdallarchaeota archaeon]MCK4954492.1 hypothetical protein [Candidatus Heimdallarchaeota archaeon]